MAVYNRLSDLFLQQTAVLCSPTLGNMMGAESRFFSSLHRLSQALKDGRVLPGAGAIEGAVIKCLDDVTSGKYSCINYDKNNTREVSKILF